MQITQSIKERILGAIAHERGNYSSQKAHATALGISPSVYTALLQGKTEKQLSEAGWLSIARRLGVALREEDEWQVVRTETFDYISSQLEACRLGSLSAILCDVPNIGKTFTARHYARTHHHVAYIDCSQAKTKRRLVRSIARELGVGVDISGGYESLYADLVYYLQSVDAPLIILDEAGDLQYEAFLELKALWNATEHCCGWYMMGADGLKAKIRRSIDCAKVGYAELFSRYGSKYSRITPEHTKEREAFELAQAMLVAQANCPEGVNARELARKAGGLRRVYTEIMKARQAS